MSCFFAQGILYVPHRFFFELLKRQIFQKGIQKIERNQFGHMSSNIFKFAKFFWNISEKARVMSPVSTTIATSYMDESVKKLI